MSVTKSDVYIKLQMVNRSLKLARAVSQFSVGRDAAGYSITEMKEGTAERTLLYGVTSKIAYNYLQGAEQAIDFIGIC